MIRKEDIKLIKNSKKYIVLSAVVFFIAFIFGALFSFIYPILAKEALNELVKAFSFLFDFEPIEMGIFLFLNNSIKIFLFMFLGVICAVPTIFFLILNGWILGYVVGVSFPELGLNGIFHSVFLHGIFELSGLFLGSAIGIVLGISVCKETKNKAFKIFPLSDNLKKLFISSFRVFSYIILPLLFIAALIETYLIYF
jgi:stage II sporulation protein M